VTTPSGIETFFIVVLNLTLIVGFWWLVFWLAFRGRSEQKQEVITIKKLIALFRDDSKPPSPGEQVDAG
jgi:hypothetical protein